MHDLRPCHLQSADAHELCASGRLSFTAACECRCSFVCEKVEDFLVESLDDAHLWDIVVLDPPKLAPSQKHLKPAAAKYVGLNRAAMGALRPGGLLMTCSCSGAVAQGLPGTFVQMVVDAARKLRRHVAVLREAGAAPDHVLDPHFTHGKYLTNVLVRVNGP
jgi:23S rRNA G2069 N7-methylase RlmK/C1962 C5-methylase RlmI